MPTKIEWTDETWNPITGCSPYSPGCDNCYARRMAQRLRGRCGYPATDPFAVTFHADRLKQPQHWRKPRRIFVCSMGDFFHSHVNLDTFRSVLLAMAKAPQHTYLLLTKRAINMRDWMSWVSQEDDIPSTLFERIWCGLTVCNQEEADQKIRHLIVTPGPVRYLSLEPLLGPIDLTDAFASGRIDWVIIGGETGPHARPMQMAWVRQIRDQCAHAGVPFFFKKWGNDGNRYLDGKLYEQYPAAHGKEF